MKLTALLAAVLVLPAAQGVAATLPAISASSIERCSATSGRPCLTRIKLDGSVQTVNGLIVGAVVGQSPGFNGECGVFFDGEQGPAMVSLGFNSNYAYAGTPGVGTVQLKVITGTSVASCYGVLTVEIF